MKKLYALVAFVATFNICAASWTPIPGTRQITSAEAERMGLKPQLRPSVGPPSVRYYVVGSPKAIPNQGPGRLLEVLYRRNDYLKRSLLPELKDPLSKAETDDFNQILSVYPIMEI
jgi:hypothetical protein